MRHVDGAAPRPGRLVRAGPRPAALAACSGAGPAVRRLRRLARLLRYDDLLLSGLVSSCGPGQLRSGAGPLPAAGSAARMSCGASGASAGGLRAGQCPGSAVSGRGARGSSAGLSVTGPCRGWRAGRRCRPTRGWRCPGWPSGCGLGVRGSRGAFGPAAGPRQAGLGWRGAGRGRSVPGDVARPGGCHRACPGRPSSPGGLGRRRRAVLPRRPGPGRWSAAPPPAPGLRRAGQPGEVLGGGCSLRAIGRAPLDWAAAPGPAAGPDSGLGDFPGDVRGPGGAGLAPG